MRAAIYARYSSDLQRPTSIEDQVRKCAQFAEQRGWRVLEEFVRSDAEVSGASLANREALDSLVSDARNRPRPFDCLLIDDTSRLGRNLTDVLKISDIFKYNEVSLYFVSQNLDSRDISFRQSFTFNGMMDEQFLIQLGSKVRRGQEGRILRGLNAGGSCYGYRNVPIEDYSRRGDHGRPAVIGVRFEIDEAQAAVIRWIFDWYGNGDSLATIAKRLNIEGITSPERPHRQSIRAWAPSSIRDILRNEKYHGKLVWGRSTKLRDPETGRKRMKRLPKEQWIWVDAPELRIVTDEQWSKVQAQIKFVNRHGIARYGGLNRTDASKEYLFSGLLVCGLCGFNITIVGGSGNFSTYGCPGYRYRGICKNSITIRRDVLESQLLASIRERVLRPDILEFTIEHVCEKFEEYRATYRSRAKGVATNAPKLHQELRRLQGRAHNLVQAIAEFGHRKSPTLIGELNDVEVKIELIVDDLRQPELPEPQASPQQIRDFVQGNVRNLEAILTENRAFARQPLRKHIKRIVLSPKFDAGGNVLAVTAGDVDVFSSDNDVLLMVPGGGIEPPWNCFRRILSPFQRHPLRCKESHTCEISPINTGDSRIADIAPCCTIRYQNQVRVVPKVVT
jgi:site-specific DNA recombinase